MELIDYLEILNRRKNVIFVTAVFAIITAAAAVISTPVKYTTTTTLRVLTKLAGGTDYVEYDIAYTERLMETYVGIAQSGPLLDELSGHVYKLPKIEVSIIPNTELISISVTDEDPGLAQYAANKLAEMLILESRKANETLDGSVNVYVVEPAIIPTEPSSTQPWIIIGLGMVAGLVGGLGLAFIYENLDTRIHNTRQVESLTGLLVLGEIPEDRNHEDEVARLYTGKNIHVEAFRRLRTNIFSQTKYSELKSLLITSAVKKDGRSFVSANLALSVASTERKVLLVDADMRFPSIHKIFGLENQKGLSDILQGTIDFEPVSSGFKSLDVIPSGLPPLNPVELLDSKNMIELMKKAAEMYDIIIIDAPSCLQVTDSVVISTYVDGVVLALREGWVREEALQSSIKQLRNVKANLLGVVTNRTTRGASVRGKKGNKKISTSHDIAEDNIVEFSDEE